MENPLRTESEIRSKYQITIPDDIRKKANLQVGDKLIWQYDETNKEILVMPKPESFAEAMWGMGKGMWKNADEYVRGERESW